MAGGSEIPRGNNSVYGPLLSILFAAGGGGGEKNCGSIDLPDLSIHFKLLEITSLNK